MTFIDVGRLGRLKVWFTQLCQALSTVKADGPYTGQVDQRQTGVAKVMTVARQLMTNSPLRKLHPVLQGVRANAGHGKTNQKCRVYAGQRRLLGWVERGG